MAETARLSINVVAHGVTQANQQLASLTATAGRTEAATTRLAASARLLVGALAAIGTAKVIQGYVAMADTMKRLEGQLRLVTGSTAELRKAQSDLFDLAQRTRTSLPSTIDLYARLARSTESVNLPSQQLLKITEAVNQAIQIGGSTASEAAAGVIQFGQALASGTLRGDELRSVLENMPRLARALKEGLVEQGLAQAAESASGALRRLAGEGMLNTERMLQALLSQVPALGKEFGKLPTTVEQAWTKLENSVLRVVSSIESEGGLSKSLVSLIDTLRKLAEDPGVIKLFEGIIATVSTLVDVIRNMLSALGALFDFAESKYNLLAKQPGGVSMQGQIEAIDQKIAWMLPRSTPANPAMVATFKQMIAERQRLEAEIQKAVSQSKTAGGFLTGGGVQSVYEPTEPAGPLGTGGAGKVDGYARLVTELERSIDLTNTLAIQEGIRDAAAKKQLEIELRWRQELAKLKDEGRQVAEAEGGFLLTLIEQQVNAEQNLAAVQNGNRIMARLAADDRTRAEQQYQDQLRATQQVAQQAFDTTRGMLTGLVEGSLTARGALSNVFDILLRIAELAAFGPQGFGGWFGTAVGNAFSPDPFASLGGWTAGGMSPKAKGGAFTSAGEIHAFRLGGVVDRATPFRFGQGGAFGGVMGEAGPEAIMPLRRGPDGSLGVVAQGGGGSGAEVRIDQLMVNVDGSKDDTPEEQAARIGKAVRRELKGLVVETIHGEMRAGGSLYRGRS